MDPVKQFEDEKKKRIEEFEKNSEFSAKSLDWLEYSMKRYYPYNFNWLGRPIIQYPTDMLAVQELVWDIKPDLIIEAGIAHGGSLILSASMLAMLDLKDGAYQNKNRKVLGLDIDIRAHNKSAIESHPLSFLIEMIEGSSIEQATIDKVHKVAAQHENVMVFLDSMHTHDHVLAELKAYAPLVSKGSYCVVFDTFVEDMPKGFFENRPWDPGNNPKTAVHAFLKENKDFEIDKQMEAKLQITCCPDGYLKKTA